MYDFVSEDGIGHTVWVIDSDTEIGLLVQYFREVTNLYIAAADKINPLIRARVANAEDGFQQFFLQQGNIQPQVPGGRTGYFRLQPRSKGFEREHT